MVVEPICILTVRKVHEKFIDLIDKKYNGNR